MSEVQNDLASVLELPEFDAEPIGTLRTLLGQEMVVELVEEFERSGVENLQRLDQALESQDAKLAQREAHSLKSAAASLGLTRLSRLCAAAEADFRLAQFDRGGELKGMMAGLYASGCELLQCEKSSE